MGGVRADGDSAIDALVAPGAAAIVEGDPLESAGDGTVRKHAASKTVPMHAHAIVGYAGEAVNNSGSATRAWLRMFLSPTFPMSALADHTSETQ